MTERARKPLFSLKSHQISIPVPKISFPLCSLSKKNKQNNNNIPVLVEKQVPGVLSIHFFFTFITEFILCAKSVKQNDKILVQLVRQCFTMGSASLTGRG